MHASLASEDLRFAQGDGAPPAVLVSGSAPGESGVAVVRWRFAGSAYLSGTARHHLIVFHRGAPTLLHCRVGERRLDHVAPDGSLAICPAGVDCAADADGGLESLALLVSAERLSLAAAQGAHLGAALAERLSGSDPALQRLAAALAGEAASGFGNGPLYRGAVADRVVTHLVERHLTQPARRSGGRLSARTLTRLTEFIHAHLDQPIQVDSLANVAAQSRFHFSRVFARTVGISPHRYVMQLRLERALGLLRQGRLSLSEVAHSAGFADQSHLTRWSRRVYGLPPGELRAGA